MKKMVEVTCCDVCGNQIDKSVDTQIRIKEGEVTIGVTFTVSPCPSIEISALGGDGTFLLTPVPEKVAELCYGCRQSVLIYMEKYHI